MDFLFETESYLCPGMYALLDLIGFSLALVFWRRCPNACALVLAACMLDMMVTIADVATNQKMFDIDLFIPFEWSYLVLAAFHWIAEALMIAAVFMGRAQMAPERFAPPLRDDDWDR